MTSLRPRPIPDAALSQVVGGAFQQTGAGNDAVTGTSGEDVLFTGGGNDTASAGSGNDQVFGEAGNDVITAGAGNDLAFGGDGHDTLNGGAGQDQLQGGAGDDSLDGGMRDGAADLAFGGSGNDGFIWAPGDGNDQFQGGEGRDTLNLDNVTLPQLQAALMLEGNTNLQMHVASSPQGALVTFTDAAGNPATFAGTVTIGGETLRFSEIEQIRLV